MDEVTTHASVVQRRSVDAPASPADDSSPYVDPPTLRFRQIAHDIHHELGTISLLAALLSTAPDVGADSQARALLLLREVRWLDQLQRAYEERLLVPVDAGGRGRRDRVRLDLIAAEVVEAIALCSPTRIELHAEEVTAYTERLAFWRVLRNVLQNAVRAAGPSGTVRVRVTAEAGWAVTHVDDDGPGFSTGPPGPDSLGLGIVQDLASASGGGVEIRRSRLGGGCVRLRMPVAPRREYAEVDGLFA